MRIDREETYGIYVHIPFCLQKCVYCDFTSYPGQLSRAACYLEALDREMAYFRGCRADTVYIGGGTPTCLEAVQLAGLVDKIRSCFRLEQDCEITVECNPKTADEKYFRTLRKAGVNRLSVGVQSFHDHELRLLGRIHTAAEAEECIRMAKNAGFSNISLDLMFGLPRQSAADVEESVRRAVSLAPTHLSCYSLILEEGTPLYRSVQEGKYALPDEDTEREMYHHLVRLLAENGYHRYEISNFALRGKESRHNNKYWERKPYIGLGAAAHSQIADLRYGNPSSLAEYEEVTFLHPPAGRAAERLTSADEMAEFMFLGLRKGAGILKSDFGKVFGKSLETVFGEPIKKFYSLGLLEDSNGRLRLSDAGIDVSNAIFCEFLPEEEDDEHSGA